MYDFQVVYATVNIEYLSMKKKNPNYFYDARYWNLCNDINSLFIQLVAKLDWIIIYPFYYFSYCVTPFSEANQTSALPMVYLWVHSSAKEATNIPYIMVPDYNRLSILLIKITVNILCIIYMVLKLGKTLHRSIKLKGQWCAVRGNFFAWLRAAFCQAFDGFYSSHIDVNTNLFFRYPNGFLCCSLYNVQLTEELY